MGKSTYSNPISNQTNFTSQSKINRILVDKDLETLKHTLHTLSKKYNITPLELTKLIDTNIEIPSSIYQNKEISTLETTVKYLKENLNLKYSQISALLNRDERTIWATYHNSLKKTKSKLTISDGISIPIKILSTRKFSILESITSYLKENHNLKFSEISKLFALDPRTIWTCYNRYKTKRDGNNEAR